MRVLFLLLTVGLAGATGAPADRLSLMRGAALEDSPTPSLGIEPGMPLAEALRRLEIGGLRLLWSSHLVPDELRVSVRPTAIEPAAQLAELLAPHGLGAERQGEIWVVVRVAPHAVPATLRGTARSQRDHEPLAGVEVRILELERRATSDAEGRFELDGVPAGTWRVQARRPGYVIDEPVELALGAGEIRQVDLRLVPAPFSGDEIVVQPSRISLLLAEPESPLALSRDEIAALPHLAGDVFRALDLLPGAVANDISAEIHVRGGRRDETLVILDGQEIYDAYHLKDFDNALSVVPAPTVDLLRLSTGALPVSRGDRMGAALELTTFSPSEPGRFRLSVSLLDFQLEASGRSRDRFSWLGSVRYGNGALAGALFGEEDPDFWDLFGKFDAALGETQSARASLLGSADRLDFTELKSGELRHFATEYGNRYFWLTHQALLSDRLYVDSSGSLVRIDRDRRGGEDEEEKRFAVRDERDTRVRELKQSWGFQPGSAGGLGTWGAGYEARRYDTRYDYASRRDFDSPFAVLRAEPRDGAFDFRGRVLDESIGAWVSHRSRPAESVTLELGARYDRHTGAGDTVWSPRGAVAWNLGGRNVLRLAAGRHTQSQRAYELMVTDGDTRLYPVERADHAALGWEHRFTGEPSRAVSGFRLEAYEHRVATPRPRYESLFEPFEPFVEGELDRTRIEPEKARARGVELFVHGRPGERFGWWLNYAWARSEDRLDGRWTARQVDQRHTLNADLTLRLGKHWNLNLAWRFHTGRPTTPVFLAFDPVPHDDDGGGEDPGEDPDEEGEESALAIASHELEPRPVLGALNSARLPDYHRLDLRLSRDWKLPRGRLTVFADVQNLYDRDNVAGYDLEIDDEGEPALLQIEEYWPGFLASAGISWQF